MTVPLAAYQEHILDRFITLKRRERLGHAYLFSGPKFSGKLETALTVAKMLNCENPRDDAPFCETCPNCAKINAGSHPDVLVSRSGFGETIKIDDIRALIERSNLMPFMARTKVFILEHSENLTTEAANALLKTLEEPSRSSLWILTTASVEKNLDTVRSRCHIVAFFPHGSAETQRRLLDMYDMGPDDAAYLAGFAEGCLGKARAYAEDGLVSDRDNFIDGFLYQPDIDAFLKGLVNDKVRTKRFLDVLQSWISDAIFHAAGRDEKMIHVARKADVTAFASRFTMDELFGIFEQIVETQNLLAENLNVKIPLLIIKEMVTWEES